MDETLREDAQSLREPEDLISVGLIDDNRMVREGLTSLLGRTGDIRVVAAAAGVAQLEDLERAGPRVILLDSGLDDHEGVEVARSLVEDFPDAGVIVMDLLPAQEDIVEFIAAGVAGFVTKDATLEVLAQTIRSVASGLKVLPDVLTGTLFSEIAR